MKSPTASLRFRVVFYFFFFINVCYSQNYWHAGYIIKNSGDTILGQIDIRSSKTNFSQCYFKNAGDEDGQVYSPLEINSYRFLNGKFFVSKSIENHNGKQQLFLELLVQSNINLFFLKVENERFFIEKSSRLYELKNSHVLVSEGSNEYLKEKQEYKGFLKALLQEAKIEQEIDRSSLKIKTLIEVAKKYHAKVCPEADCYVYEKQKAPVQVNWEVYGGVSMAKIKFGKTTSGYKLNPVFGIGVGFENLIDWETNMIFKLGLSFQRFSNFSLTPPKDLNFVAPITYNRVDYLLSSVNSALVVKSLDANLKAVFVKVPVSVNYKFLAGKIRPNVEIGFLNMFTLSQNDEFKYQYIYKIHEKSVPGYLIGFFAGAGADFIMCNNKAIFLEAGYESSKNIEVDQQNSFFYSSFMLKLGYSF